ncbi:MAG: isopeptide-forming domain-containing fimbrial protein [Ruminococcus sp.]|nr:isopeptide-forming domain-containing fimbrial protein [Ruminococcus sp.]
MKKTNKTRKIATMIAAMALAATMAIPSAMMTASAEDVAEVTITGLDASVARTFEVYQVFTGKYDTDKGSFSELKWGSGVTSYDETDVTAGELVADSVLENLGNDARAIVGDLELGTATKTVQSSAAILKIDGLADGYYVIKDVTNMDDKDDANSAWIVQVAADGKTTNIAIKKETPSVDKQVLDETADAEAGATDGWGESADHAINETFQFKLTATIPANNNFAAYDSYKLVFNDTMSSGVTYEDIESVTITSSTLTGTKALELTASQYTETATAATSKAGLTWSLSIADVKALVNADDADIFGKEEITVEVIYNAHLNENAIISTASGNDLNVNNNKVDLQYSNNPDNTGTGTSLGKTPEDFVWVFTYEVDNTKYKISADSGNELAGAGFTLYSDSAKQTEIKLIDNGDGTYTVADQTATTGVVTEMTSHTGDGIFNIKGLDAGTYYLSETSVPDGYNAADDITITIGATHIENNAKNAANLTLSGTNVDNDIVDTKNSTLPSTGGMGTTLFVIGGGVTAAAAGIYLVSKKRAKDAE